MGVQLNIKSERAYELARQISDMTGESLTEAVIAALDERLARVRKPSPEQLVAKWAAIGEDIKRRYPDMPGSQDIDALLYDEHGLPA